MKMKLGTGRKTGDFRAGPARGAEASGVWAIGSFERWASSEGAAEL